MSTTHEITVRPIGVVRAPRVELTDDEWGGMISQIELDAEQLPEEATLGLAEFSHLEVIFFFHKAPPEEIQRGARRPRGRADWPEVGILAQRGKGRPNRLGVSRCRLLSVDGLCLTVEGLDAISGTPVLDIKPYLTEFGPRGEVRQPDWSRALMANYYSVSPGASPEGEGPDAAGEAAPGRKGSE